jgi:hypothetical protein
MFCSQTAGRAAVVKGLEATTAEDSCRLCFPLVVKEYSVETTARGVCQEARPSVLAFSRAAIAKGLCRSAFQTGKGLEGMIAGDL